MLSDFRQSDQASEDSLAERPEQTAPRGIRGNARRRLTAPDFGLCFVQGVAFPMQADTTAQCADCRNGECVSLGAASEARLFVSVPPLGPHTPMIAPLRNVLEQSSDERVTPRLSVRRVRSWTGRSAVARATDSHLSRVATAGTGMTRVSAMRILPVRDDRFALQHANVVTDRVPPLRRMDPGPPIISG
jgi:hypothetical protein